MVPIEGEERIGGWYVDLDELLEAVELVVVDLDGGDIDVGDEEIGMDILQL